MSCHHFPVFSQNPLDRMDHLRAEIRPLAETSHRYILLSDGQIVVNHQQDCFWPGDEVAVLCVDSRQAIFLGGREEHYYFAVSVPQPPLGAELVDIRSFAQRRLLADVDMGIIAEAGSMLKWHQSHGFCARCGHPSRVVHGGWRRDCPSCEAQHFPRTDPVAIMLVTYGDQCLLGRGHQFDEQQYSCLAGFIEPAETIEDGARRELFEEAGICGGEVHYLCSQPWPFPSSLMIGMQVTAKSQALTIDHNELADAIWVNKSDVKAVLEGATDRGFILPPRIAIAHTLMEYWVNS